MLLVIFGAGASWDSVDLERTPIHEHPDYGRYRPPLTSELFQHRVTFGPAVENFPEAAMLIAELRGLGAGLELEKNSTDYKAKPMISCGRNSQHYGFISAR